MPPIKKINKEDIINTAYEIIKQDGVEGINARRIAKELNCSIQPIFHNFENMEELKKQTVRKIHDTYQEMMKEATKKQKPYKEMGMSYIKFAKEYPNFFKLLFMSENTITPETFIIQDDLENEIIKNGQELTGFDVAEQKKFHLKVWIFTHGLATLIATKTCCFTQEQVSKLLEDTVREMLKGYKGGKENGK